MNKRNKLFSRSHIAGFLTVLALLCALTVRADGDMWTGIPLPVQQATSADSQQSGISILYWSDSDHIELECGQTYTTDDISYIKSGSLTISEDGKTLTFDHLTIECTGSSTSSILNIDIFHGYPRNSSVSIKLIGDNKLQTEKGYEVLNFSGVDQLTIFGEGTLTMRSDYIDITLSSGYYGVPGGELVIDNTSVTSQGYYAVSSCRNIHVKHSRFEGNQLFYVDSLTMEGCSIMRPVNGWFDYESESNKIKDENGQTASHFIISTPDDNTIPSNIAFSGQTLVCGHTYTSEEFPSITSGSMSVSADGRTLTLDNLLIDSGSGELFDVKNEHLTLFLIGNNVLKTSGSYVMSNTYGSLLVTGEGTLTTASDWYDFWLYGCDVTIENTTLTCNGYRSFGNNMWATDYLLVKNSTFRGRTFFRIKSLTLINCAFVEPTDVTFKPDDDRGGQLYRSDGSSISNFEIQPVEGDFRYVVSPSDFETVIIEKDTEADVNITMKQEGLESVQSISYVLSYNGVEQQECTVSLREPFSLIGHDFNITIPFPASHEAGNTEAELNITKVNGQENKSQHKVAKGIVRTVGEAFPHRVVVEEFTGTWCGWCPRGAVALNMLNEEYGDSIITIAVHSSDPMAISYGIGANSFPSAKVNRSDFVDPYYGISNESFGIKTLVDYELSQLPVAGIEATAEWVDDSLTSINIYTDVQFCIDADSSRYGIGYVLLEDGMTGTGEDWKQSNNYSGSSTNDPNLQAIASLSSPITVYDHVAVNSWGVNKGVDDIKFSTIEAGMTQQHLFVADISSNQLIQNKSQLSIVAILIDRQTGTIINGAKCSININSQKGDVNTDGSVGIGDIVAITNMMAGITTDEAVKTQADVNGDGEVGIGDIVAITNIMAGINDSGKPTAYLTCPDGNHPHMIDLGLPSGTLWACCNVGANSPEEYGEYYAWGETTEWGESTGNKDNYDWSTYAYWDGAACSYLAPDIAGTNWDVAHVKWGTPWQIPSNIHEQELLENCTSEWTTLNGVNGRKFTGANGGTIFIPAAGRRVNKNFVFVGSYGQYWSSVPYSNENNARGFLFNSNSVNGNGYWGRSDGLSVRPVATPTSYLSCRGELAGRVW